MHRIKHRHSIEQQSAEQPQYIPAPGIPQQQQDQQQEQPEQPQQLQQELQQQLQQPQQQRYDTNLIDMSIYHHIPQQLFHGIVAGGFGLGVTPLCPPPVVNPEDAIPGTQIPAPDSNATTYDNSNFMTLHNFRDIGVSTTGPNQRYIKTCMFFRSATLDNASEEEVHRLVHNININTIIDLRSEVEVKTAKESGRAFASFPMTVVTHMKKRDLIKKELLEKDQDKAKIKQHSENRTIMINFAGRRYRQHAVIYAASWQTRLKLVELIKNDQKAQAVTLVGREIISPKGLIGLYKDFIDYCYREIGEALKYLADFKNYPILIHCTQGKDRTGLVVALALYSLRVPEEQIVQDYARTTYGLAPIKELMISEMARDGLSPEFSDSPAEVLRETFAYIKEKYGSVQHYLDKTKFTRVYRDAMRNILMISPH